MKRIISLLAVVALLLATACKSGQEQTTPQMQSSLDSMSYVVGLNVGLNLMEMDSTINVDMVCEGIRDAFNRAPKFNDEEARTAFLKYMNYDNYERVKRFEQQFLEDLRREDRKFVATGTGLTYKIGDIGNLKTVIRSTRDTIHLQCRILNIAGEIVDTTYYRLDTLRTAVGDIPRGVQEAARLIGEGGTIEAWVPSQLAYGAGGNDSLGVKPNTLLYYEMKLVEVEQKKQRNNR